ncbi:MAG: SDR family oxidoreductase [Propionibacteriaceae bacterium]
MSLKVLFLGGTGTISSACTRLAVERGMDVSILNRGTSSTRPAPEEATLFTADLTDPAAVRTAVGAAEFDVVVDNRAFVPADVRARLDVFAKKCGQYVFISSASAYQTPPGHLPVTESTPLRNPYWEYSQDKIACEDLLVQAYREDGLPVTIVRPSHTYDHTSVPVDGGWTVVDRMRRGAEVVVHGDGTSLWTLTHSRDFAKAFVGLLGLPAAIGQAIHITSDEFLAWNEIFSLIGQAAGVEPRLVHVPSDVIAAENPGWGAGLLGDKTHSMIFDNSLVKSLVPDYVATTTFARGVHEIIDWYDADPGRRSVDEETNAVLDGLVERFRIG